MYTIDLCEAEDPAFVSLREESESLSPYGVAIRYPGDAPEISVEEARQALVAAEMIWDLVRGVLPRDLRISIPEGGF